MTTQEKTRSQPMEFNLTYEEALQELRRGKYVCKDIGTTLYPGCFTGIPIQLWDKRLLRINDGCLQALWFAGRDPHIKESGFYCYKNIPPLTDKGFSIFDFSKHGEFFKYDILKKILLLGGYYSNLEKPNYIYRVRNKRMEFIYYNPLITNNTQFEWKETHKISEEEKLSWWYLNILLPIDKNDNVYCANDSEQEMKEKMMIEESLNGV